MSGFPEYDDMLAKLGNWSSGKSCLYVKRLADVDMMVLKELIDASVTYMRETHHTDDTHDPDDTGVERDTGEKGSASAVGDTGDKGKPVLRD